LQNFYLREIQIPTRKKGNPRFRTYCPFCQISTAPTSLPQGLKEPPAYSPPPDQRVTRQALINNEDGLPPYSAVPQSTAPAEKSTSSEPAEDVLHFLNPEKDTLPALSLRYGVPLDVLKKANGLWSDNLLQARRTIIIPGQYYKGGVSLSPQPVEGEDEEKRKSKIRRWMVACKQHE
jgi:LysM domain